MNKTALFGILMALVLPLAGYFIVKGFSKDITPMPRRYYYDSVSTRMDNGKQVVDTHWRKVPDTELTNQLGRKVRLSDLEGKVLVIDFFFTHCPTICPQMTYNMKRLQDGMTSGQRVGDKHAKFVHLLSISVDPERDSLERLRAWANRFGIDPDKWWLLTGDRKTIYDFSINELKLMAVDGAGVDTGFIHSDRLVLIDKNRHIRGYYHGLDTASVGQLSRDVVLVSLEKDPKRKSIFAGKLETLAILVFAVIGGFTILFYLLKKDKKNHGAYNR